MYIRVKMKTLATLVLLLAALLLAGYFYLPTILVESRKYMLVANYFPNSRQAPQALLLAAQEVDPGLGQVARLTVYVDGNYGETGQIATPDQNSAAIKILQRLISHYPNGNQAWPARYNLATVYWQLGDWQKATLLFKQIAAQPNMEQFNAKWMLGIPYNPTSENDRGIICGTVTADHHPLAHAYVMVRAKPDHGLMYWDSAEESPGGYTDSEGHFKFFVQSGWYQLGIAVTPRQIAGYYLPPQTTEFIRVENKSTQSIDVHFVSQITVNFPSNGAKVTGSTVRFSWNRYPGAASYQLSLTDITQTKNGLSSQSVPLPKTWTGTMATYSWAELHNIMPGGSKDSVNGLVPAAVLGALYPGGEFSWSVTAFSSNGHILSSSQGYYITIDAQQTAMPIFYTDTRGQLAGDNDVLQYQWQKAKKAYLKYGKNPYALRALAAMALYGTGWKDKGDPDEALYYLEQIVPPDSGTQALIQQARKVQFAQRQSEQ